MTRLQKKCVVGAAGTHLLIIVALFCSGFIKPSPKVEQADVLTAIPANIVEHALNTGVQNAPPPAPTPPQPPTPTPTPPVPSPTVTQPPVPIPPPITRPVEPVQPTEPPDRTEVTPEPVKPKPPKPAPPKVQVDLTVVHRNSQDVDKAAEEQREAQRQARLERERREKAMQAAINNIENNSSSSTDVRVPDGSSAAAVANYASIVKTVYTQAWMPPDDAQNDEANVKVRVTIQRDGTVTAARIVGPSGDGGLDQSVQRTLDRISSLEPFPEGMTESEHTYTINFNLKAKRQAE